MKTVGLLDLPSYDQQRLREAVAHLPRSLNKITSPSTCALVTTADGQYFGNNIFLSNDTLACAEANALAAAVAAGDPDVQKLFLVIHRPCAKPAVASPCGNCRQWLLDFARLHNHPIEVLCATDKLDEILVTNSEELLPGGFRSAGLDRMTGKR